MDLKNIIADETYENLRASLLHSGRGRPKNIRPDIPVNNRLLVQLSFLREEGNRPLDVIDQWMFQICPSLGEQAGAKSRFVNLVLATREKFASMACPEDRDAFLNQQMDLDFISPSLSEIGITRSTIEKCPESVPECLELRKEVVLDLEKFCSQQGLSKSILFQWIGVLTGFEKSKLHYAINTVKKNYFKLVRNSHKDRESLNMFLKSKFSLPSSQQKENSSVTAEHKTNACSDRPINTPNKVVLRLPCLDCSEKTSELKDVMAVMKSVQKDKKEMELEILKLKADKAKLVELSENQKDRLQSKHKNEKGRYYDEKKALKVQREMLKRECREITNELMSQSEYICQLENKVMECKSAIRNLRLQLKKEKQENKSLKQKIVKIGKEDPCNLDIDLKDDVYNQYNENVRRAVLSLQCDAGVSSSNVSKVIDIVSRNIFNHKFSYLPSRQTSVNICDEGLAISNMQIVENVLKSNNVTIHSDGTSRDHKKIVGHQFSLDSGETFFWGFTPIATEDANSLLDLTINVIQKLADSFSDFSNVSSEVLLKDILSKITSTMTDRAAAMKLFHTKFNEFLQSKSGTDVQLKFLHCNAHFLLGLSAACEKAINAVESTFSTGLGRDKSPLFQNFREAGPATKRIIRAVCNVLGPRGDQKNGCRSEWLTFCSNSLIPSFKSNRFNCFFQAAAAIIFHHSKMITFFTSGILHENPNKLIQSVTLDIQDDNLMCFVCAIALFFLKVSGPYWKLVNSSVKYTDFHLYVQTILSSFQKWSDDPFELMQPSFKSVFDRFSFDDDVMFKAVHDFLQVHDTSLISSALKSLSNEAKLVTERQLADFINDGYFSQVSDDSTIEALKHCPLTNLIGESAFGDFDFDVSRRRHASLHNRSAVHVVKRNKTTNFISKKSFFQQRRIFKIARRKGSLLRQQHKLEEEEVKNKIREKFRINQQKKMDKELAQINKRSKLKDDVLAHGGPCSNSEELDKLLDRLKTENSSKTNIIKALKAEIRYLNATEGKRIIKFGSIESMTESLKDHLDQQPPRKKQRTS